RPRGKARKASQPASPDHAAVSGRFVAFPAPPGPKQTYKFMYGSLAAYVAFAFIGVPLMMYATGGQNTGTIAGIPTLFFALGFLVFGGFALFLAVPRFFGRQDRRKKIVICVTNEGVTVDQRPRDVYSFGDAQLGLWIPAGIVSITIGAALHLRCARDRFV